MADEIPSRKPGIKIVIIIAVLLIGVVAWLVWIGAFMGKSLDTIKARADQRTNYEAIVKVDGITNQISRAGAKIKAVSTLSPGIEIYQDFGSNKIDFYSPANQSYFELDNPSKQVAYADLYADYDPSAKSVKTESVNGVRALKFELNNQDGAMTLWANPKTGLPVQIIIGDSTITLSYRSFGEVGEESVTLPPEAKKTDSAAAFAEAVAKLQPALTSQSPQSTDEEPLDLDEELGEEE